MGSATCQEAQLLVQDMKVTIHKTSMVFPSKETEKNSFFLSNIDKVLNFDVDTVHFFAANKDFPPEIVIEKFNKALSDVLVAYDFFAGRIKMNSETKRLEIDCNAEGAGFVVASSEYELDQIGDLAYPNPAFAQFVHKTKDFIKPGDVPLCVAQVQIFSFFYQFCFLIATLVHVVRGLLIQLSLRVIFSSQQNLILSHPRF